jgi:hypothetical protein
MNSALRLILGLSILATAAGCDGGGEEPGGPKAVAGNGTVIPNGGSSGSGGGGSLPPGVPLAPTDGWVAVDSNTLGVQGAMFAYADETSKAGPPVMTENFVGTSACIAGTAAKVDLTCTPMAPAVDCYGQFWGAAIGLNMNQPIDPATNMGGTPMEFDASAITGFAFEIEGAAVPASLRFKVEDAAGEYCTPPAKPVKVGPNTFMFADLIKECWKAGGATAEAAKTGIIKIAWQVVTNDKAAVPFDYCVKDVRALQ